MKIDVEYMGIVPISRHLKAELAWATDKQVYVISNMCQRTDQNVTPHSYTTHSQWHYQSQLTVLLFQSKFCQPCKVMTEIIGY